MTTRGGGVDDETNLPAAITAFLQHVPRTLAGRLAGDAGGCGQANGATLASADALLNAPGGDWFSGLLFRRFVKHVLPRAFAGRLGEASADAGQANGGTLASTDALLDAQWTG